MIFPMNVARFGRIFGAEDVTPCGAVFYRRTARLGYLKLADRLYSERMGSLRLGMLTLIASVVVLLVLQVGLMRGRPTSKLKSLKIIAKLSNRDLRVLTQTRPWR